MGEGFKLRLADGEEELRIKDPCQRTSGKSKLRRAESPMKVDLLY